MIIPISKLMPLMIAGGIAVHSKDAIEQRISKIIGKEFRAKHNMSVILHSVQMDTIGAETVDIGDEAEYIRKHATQRSGDPAEDPWGTPYAIFFKQNRVWLFSAGPDKRFNTNDDLKQSVEVLNN